MLGIAFMERSPRDNRGNGARVYQSRKFPGEPQSASPPPRPNFSNFDSSPIPLLPRPLGVSPPSPGNGSQEVAQYLAENHDPIGSFEDSGNEDAETHFSQSPPSFSQSQPRFSQSPDWVGSSQPPLDGGRKRGGEEREDRGGGLRVNRSLAGDLRSFGDEALEDSGFDALPVGGALSKEDTESLIDIKETMTKLQASKNHLTEKKFAALTDKVLFEYLIDEAEMLERYESQKKNTKLMRKLFNEVYEEGTKAKRGQERMLKVEEAKKAKVPSTSWKTEEKVMLVTHYLDNIHNDPKNKTKVQHTHRCRCMEVSTRVYVCVGVCGCGCVCAETRCGPFLAGPSSCGGQALEPREWRVRSEEGPCARAGHHGGVQGASEGFTGRVPRPS
jgi:hypothetical protein